MTTLISFLDVLLTAPPSLSLPLKGIPIVGIDHLTIINVPIFTSLLAVKPSADVASTFIALRIKKEVISLTGLLGKCKQKEAWDLREQVLSVVGVGEPLSLSKNHCCCYSRQGRRELMLSTVIFKFEASQSLLVS